jgi:glycosyltransferase involved in cell wall biosynthesis
MRVAFVLPPDFGAPAGGYAVAYEYANRLANQGHDVDVVHLDPHRFRPSGGARAWIRRLWRTQVRPASWYSFDRGVRVRSAGRLGRSVSRADRVVATAWRTAYAVADLDLGPGRSFYLIQHYEVWDGPPDEVDGSWKLPLTRLVIGGWLEEKAAELNALPVVRMPNGIDGRIYRPSSPAGTRDPATVAMLWHPAVWKGSTFGLTALGLVREQIPDLTVHFFSTAPRPEVIPSWVTWHAAPAGAAVAAIYNSASIFVSPSLTEGWPLPPAEAMACGTALVTTEIPGVADYAWQDRTAVLVPPGSAEALAEAIVLLIRDDARRVRLAQSGHDLIHDSFTWEKASERMLAALAAPSAV